MKFRKFLIKRSGRSDLGGGIELNITEKKVSEARLQRSRALLQSVFDGISDPLFLLDASLRLQAMNQATTAYFGTSFQEALGRPCQEAFSCRQADSETCKMKYHANGKDRISFERPGCLDPRGCRRGGGYPRGRSVPACSESSTCRIPGQPREP
ncbi:MAG: PAS domain-containing protein [Desulfohalobiaceae bacterium]|nr:PAS domain-containing protein [Desulfohalobiaceae bacterium]